MAKIWDLLSEEKKKELAEEFGLDLETGQEKEKEDK